MTKNNRLLLSGLAIAALLFCGPLILLVATNYAGTPAESGPTPAPAPTEPITGPAPPVGLSPNLIRWTLLCGGLGLGVALGAWLAVRVRGPDPADPDLLPDRARLALLSVLGAASLFIYGLCFWLPFPLSRYYNLKLISLGLIADRDSGIVLAHVAAIVGLFLMQGLAYHLSRGRHGRRLWAAVLVIALLLALANFFVAPITSIDLYDYIARGRITGVHGDNPYLQIPNEYPGDPFMGYASWGHETSAYGPAWETISAVLSRLGGDRLWTNVLLYKGLALLSYVLCVLLIAAILRRKKPEWALAGTLLFAWNPLVLHEGLANGHNDLLMALFMLAAFWMLGQLEEPLRRPDTRAGRLGLLLGGGAALLLLGFSILLKFVPVLLLPLFAVYLLAGQRSWWQRLGLGLALLLALGLLALAYYAPLWTAGSTDTFARRFEMFRMSVGSVAEEALLQSVDPGMAQKRVALVMFPLFALSYLGLLLRQAWAMGWAWAPRLGPRLAQEPGLWGLWGRFLAGRPDVSPERVWDVFLGACHSALLLYLLLANFWFWPWYLIWPLALLALTNDRRTRLPLALAGCAGLISHLGWN
ncbi:MAG: hypothetical protein JXA37_13230, partial [Chloroflexia bacterium]|nr:hypothetical protein [Chloroflexia bacterium]